MISDLFDIVQAFSAILVTTDHKIILEHLQYYVHYLGRIAMSHWQIGLSSMSVINWE